MTALALLAGWAQWQLLDNGAWTGTSERLLENDEIRERLAVFLVTEVRGASGVAIRPDLGEALDDRVADELDSDRSKRVWRVVTGEAHRELVRLIEDDEASRGDVVVLDLRPLIRSVARELNIPLGGLSRNTAQIEIVAGDEVRGARTAADQLQRTAAVLLIAAPLILLLAVLAATGWRMRALAGAGLAVAVAGGLVLVARALVGAHVVEVLTPNSADRDAVGAAWSVGTSLLAWMSGAAIVVGLAVAVGASVAAGSRERSAYLAAPGSRGRGSYL